MPSQNSRGQRGAGPKEGYTPRSTDTRPTTAQSSKERRFQ